jgi:hypothetical protein
MAELPFTEAVGTGGQRRVDPRPAPTDAVSAQGVLVGKNPDKHYVWVSKVGDPTFNVGTYRAKGYKVERFDKDNPNEARPVIGCEEYGAPIEAVACVLMSCSLEQKRKLDAQAQLEVDRIQHTIRHGRVDPLSAADRAQYQHIRFERDLDRGDNRPNWEF